MLLLSVFPFPLSFIPPLAGDSNLVEGAKTPASKGVPGSQRGHCAPEEKRRCDVLALLLCCLPVLGGEGDGGRFNDSPRSIIGKRNWLRKGRLTRPVTDVVCAELGCVVARSGDGMNVEVVESVGPLPTRCPKPLRRETKKNSQQ